MLIRLPSTFMRSLRGSVSKGAPVGIYCDLQIDSGTVSNTSVGISGGLLFYLFGDYPYPPCPSRTIPTCTYTHYSFRNSETLRNAGEAPAGLKDNAGAKHRGCHEVLKHSIHVWVLWEPPVGHSADLGQKL